MARKDTKGILNRQGDVDIERLLLGLADASSPLDERIGLWQVWIGHYDKPHLMDFFQDVLFGGDTNYLSAWMKAGTHADFYDLAMELDLEGIDHRACYLFWLLCCAGPDSFETELAKEALEYDPEGIRAIFPDALRIVFGHEIGQDNWASRLLDGEDGDEEGQEGEGTTGR